jgi:hypothetical protein
MYQEYNITIQARYATRQSVKHHPQQHIASNFPQAQTPCAKRTCGKKTTKDNATLKGGKEHNNLSGI